MTTIARPQNKKRKKGINATKRNYFMDIAISVGFLAAFGQEITGETLHEWIGLALLLGLLTHLLLHWKWVINITKRIFSKKLKTKTRLNYLIVIGLLMAFVMMGVSGLAMSESVMPLLTGGGNGPNFWEDIHEATSSATMVLIVSHLLLHTKWIIHNTKKYLIPQKG